MIKNLARDITYKVCCATRCIDLKVKKNKYTLNFQIIANHIVIDNDNIKFKQLPIRTQHIIISKLEASIEHLGQFKNYISN